MLQAKTTEKRDPLPAGYRWGAFTSGDGWEGRYVVRESDGIAATVRTDSDADPADELTPLQIDAQIAEDERRGVQSICATWGKAVALLRSARHALAGGEGFVRDDKIGIL